ncbi:hypothetical protein AKJ39_02070 [candidate division MSBL1 archaeon SCGC-AAA259J03]|uniref:Pyruvate/ketoisovalerate oxidoreductase catalytic domain-containing protein n=1 Tax=candidate division MSBL1 archaeon SCGC-AAA259J03 TaxID=1698269 RepID=A0A656YYK5_9EURY|nr:hypothetical protein AKJ39_02070 [candidate division MSBL1 archaeon SCGC-AAA259J03]
MSEVAVREGLNVNTYEVLGTAHRGTLVFSFVRMSENIKEFSNQIPAGEADLLIGFEPLEALRLGMLWMSEEGLAILNTKRVIPIYESLGKDVFSDEPRPRGYPPNEEISDFLESTGATVMTVDASEIAEKLGNKVVVNTVMLGMAVASGVLPLSKETFKDTIKILAPEGTAELNLQAFQTGIDTLPENPRSI